MLLAALLATNISPAIAQEITQTIRGTVRDEVSQQRLEGVSVYLPNTTPAIGTTTDTSGQFILKEVPVGRYTVRFSSVGYQAYAVPVLVRSGKEAVVDVALTQSAQNLEEVVITDQREVPATIAPLSSRSFSVEETRRYAATFFDPARLVTSFPGVVAINDQANHISVRGNSPNALLWRLEGIDIVNPNHLSNAGTFGDRRVASGGSQSVLSAQVLDDSQFFSGAYPARYGNAVGGVMDMRLRRGNNQQTEYTAQLGLIGLNFAAEGPFREEYDGSYLANYRYSTVGILTNVLGLDFGGEQIAFQDLSFNLSFPTKKLGDFTLFGVGGTGSNVFEALRDSTQWEVQEDRFDVTFNNDMAAVGLTHTLSLGQHATLKTVAATSALSSDRLSNRVDDTYATVRVSEDNYQEVRLSIASSFIRKLTGGHTLRTGLYFDNLSYQLSSSVGDSADLSSLVQGEGSGQLVRPYAEGKFALSAKWVLNAGLHFAYFSLNGSQSLEPRLALQWNTVPRQSFILAYGRHSQLQLPGVYFYAAPTNDEATANPNVNLGFTKSDQYTTGYNYQLGSGLKLRTEVYYQHLFDVPIAREGTFSTLNLLEGFVPEPLVSEGTGRNYGIEVSGERQWFGGYYFLGSGSLYESKYTAGDGIERDTRYNGNFALSLTGGKEITWNKSGKQRTLGINLRSVYAGGLRTTPLDATASRVVQSTVFLEDQAFSEQLPSYFKIDVRISWQKDTPRYSSVWSLDLQNATNRQNVAYQYYDTVQREVLTQYQLGLIPILTYRIEF